MPLHPDLDAIVSLDTVDERISGFTRELEKHRKAMADASAALDAARREREAAQAEAAAAKAEEHALQRKTHSYEERKRAAERVLDTGTGSADAAEKQLSQVRAILDEVETETLQLYERQEAIAAKVAARKAAVEAAEAVLQAALHDLPPEIDRVEARIAEERPKRAEAAKDVRRDLLAMYELKRQRKGRAVALVDHGGCRSCRRMVPSQQLSDLVIGKIVLICNGCERFLVPA